MTPVLYYDFIKEETNETVREPELNRKVSESFLNDMSKEG